MRQNRIEATAKQGAGSDFITLRQKFDEEYPKDNIIRVICDNHSPHKSKETQNYPESKPQGRFVFVFTPKHGSWLSMIESLLSKMTKQMIRGIRVNFKEEFEQRSYLCFEEVNAEPVVFRWKYRLDQISQEEAMTVATAITLTA